MRASGRGWALALWMCGLVVVTTCLVYGQGSKKSSEFDATEERDRDHPRARDEWFMRGRTAPNGESAAALRFRAYQQKTADAQAAIRGALGDGGAAVVCRLGLVVVGPRSFGVGSGDGAELRRSFRTRDGGRD